MIYLKNVSVIKFFLEKRNKLADDLSSKFTTTEKWESIISGELLKKHKQILGSVSGSGPKLPRFKALLIQGSCFCDLNFRLGAGFLYCHQAITSM